MDRRRRAQHGTAEAVRSGRRVQSDLRFQHWCPGCHSHGFPTPQKLIKALGDRGFAFAAVQTVFEGAESNTFERLRETQLRYGLNIPFGHDPAIGRASSLMADYGTRGTPWFW